MIKVKKISILAKVIPTPMKQDWIDLGKNSMQARALPFLSKKSPRLR